VALTPRRSGAVATILLGLLVMVAAHATATAPLPVLYDGVVTIEPYRFLAPPAGRPGGARGATSTVALHGGKSPLLALATPEQPPQAQFFAAPGSLNLPAGATQLSLGITPVPAEGTPLTGHLAGNVYRFSVVDQSGAPVTAPASAYVNVVIRGPEEVVDATVERFSNGTWQPLKTVPSGFGATFIAVVTQFGDFALVAPGPGPAISPGPSGANVGASASPAPSGSGLGNALPQGNESSGPPLLVLAGLAGVGLLGVAIAVRLLTADRRRPPPSARRRQARRR
jgi:hypothetical protein